MEVQVVREQHINYELDQMNFEVKIRKLIQEMLEPIV